MLPAYNVRVEPLDTAQTEKEIQLPGSYLEFATDGSLTGISFHLPGGDDIPVDRFKKHRFPDGFDKFYVTWTAQSGKSLWIFVGRHGAQTARV